MQNTNKALAATLAHDALTAEIHEQILTPVKSVVIRDSWCGTLNDGNIDAIAQAIRDRLQGKRFSIASCQYADSGRAYPELTTDCVFNSSWTTVPAKEPVRVFTSEDDGRKYFGFSAGGYCWMWHSHLKAEQLDHEDYKHAWFKFDYDGFTVTQYAPAGKGHLHIHIFKRQAEGK